MRHSLSLIPASAIALLCSACSAETRIFTYRNLVEAAELVVIGSASVPRAVANSSSFYPQDLQQLESKIQVDAVLKGAMPQGPLKLVHFRYLKGRPTLLGGPHCIVLDTELTRGAKPRYLLFLKLREDGRYGPVSGDMRPAVSFLRLHPASSTAIATGTDNP